MCGGKTKTNRYIIRRQNYRNFCMGDDFFIFLQKLCARSTAINSKLREVEALPTDQTAALLPEMGGEEVLDEE